MTPLPPPRHPAVCFLLLFIDSKLSFCHHFLQEISPRAAKGAGAQEASHQEATQRLHALHERDACQRGGRVHAKGERRHQPDTRQKGKCPLYAFHH